jgi:hypothetical protein
MCIDDAAAHGLAEAMENVFHSEPNGIIRDAILQLIQECKCPICLEFFTEPRNAPCQHNFCEACIYEHIKDHHSECPTCRHPGVNKRSLAKNNSLANISNCVKRLSSALGITPNSRKSQTEAQPVNENITQHVDDRRKIGKRYGKRSKGVDQKKPGEVALSSPLGDRAKVAEYSKKISSSSEHNDLSLSPNDEICQGGARHISKSLEPAESARSSEAESNTAGSAVDDGSTMKNKHCGLDGAANASEHGNAEGESLYFVDFGGSLVIPSFPSESDMALQSPGNEHPAQDKMPVRLEGSKSLHTSPQDRTSLRRASIMSSVGGISSARVNVGKEVTPARTTDRLLSVDSSTTRKRTLENQDSAFNATVSSAQGTAVDERAGFSVDSSRSRTRPRTMTGISDPPSVHGTGIGRLSAAKTVDPKLNSMRSEEQTSKAHPWSATCTSPMRSPRDTSNLPSPCRLDAAFSRADASSHRGSKADVAGGVRALQPSTPLDGWPDRTASILSPASLKQTRSQVFGKWSIGFQQGSSPRRKLAHIVGCPQDVGPIFLLTGFAEREHQEATALLQRAGGRCRR